MVQGSLTFMVLVIVIIFIIPKEDRRQHPGLLKAKGLKIIRRSLYNRNLYSLRVSGPSVLLNKHAQNLCHTSQDDKMWSFIKKSELEPKITEQSNRQNWEQDYIMGQPQTFHSLNSF